jgi:type I restriction enzyme S subunit
VGEWETVPLDSLIEPGRGISYGIVQPGAPVADGVPVVRVSDVRHGRVEVSAPLRVAPAIEAAYARTRLAGGELLLTLVGTVGEAAIAPASLAGWNTARAVAVIPVRKEVGAYWVKLALQAPGVREIINSRLNTTVQATLNLGDVAQLPIALPPLGDRSAIAHILGTLDDKIELNRRMSETLEAMARALFKSWFVDFDPVRAKMEGRDPGLPKPLSDLFPDCFENSELGQIPRGWGVKPLSHCVDVARGLSYKGSGLSDRGLPMHNLNSIYEGGGYKHDGLKFYDGEYKSQHLALAGDLIVANTEQGHHRLLIGCAAIVPSRFGAGSLFSHHIYRVRPRSDSRLTSDFLYHLLSTGVMHDIVSGFANGTTVNMLPIDALQSPLIVVPPARAISRFSDIAVAARMRHEEMIEESRTLAALRDALLPKLISGELGIKGVLPFSSDRTLDGRRATGVRS